MGPKKGKKGTKKGVKKKDKKETEGEEVPEISVLDKNYYTTQVQALERTLDRSNQKCEQLINAEKYARDQYRTLHQEKVDIVCFLRTSLKSREDEIEELRSRLNGLLKAKQTEGNNYEEKLKILNQEFSRTKNDLSDQILSLTRKLESLEEFRLQKEDLESQHSLLQSTFERVKEEHKEKMSSLERTSIEESEAMRKAQQEMLIQMKEELRKEARMEMHSTTRSALVENESLKNTLAIIKSKVVKLRQENSELRSELSDVHIREAVLHDSLTQLTSTAERRSVLLKKVAEKADQHSRVIKDYNSLLEEKEKMKRDLQQMQVQLDAATRMSCDLRESSSEKALALELLSTKIQEERKERIRSTGALNSALQILQENIFGRPDAFDSTEGAKPVITNKILTQLVDILSGAEAQKIPPEDEQRDDTKQEIRNKTDPLVTYSTGDLGLVPRKNKNKFK